jgi:hypothetical protein
MFDVTLCFIINGYLARHLPLLEGFALSFMVLAFVGVIATLLVLSPKLSGSEVFQSFTPSSELGSRQALELVASQLGIFYSFLGSDSTVHMVGCYLSSECRFALMSSLGGGDSACSCRNPKSDVSYTTPCSKKLR